MQQGNARDGYARGTGQDDQVRADHELAVARGEKRVLCRTREGRLHSYARDEIGVVNARSHPTVRSTTGFTVMAVFFAAMAVFSVLLVAGPTRQGDDPLWGALVLTAAGVCGALYATRLALTVSRAKRVRLERGIPEPSSKQFDWA